MSNIRSRLVSSVPTAPATPAAKAKRPAILAGVAQVHVWLKAEAEAILAKPVSEKTQATYAGNGMRLDARRIEGEAIDLTPHLGKARTFYAYRAAVRWDAARRGLDAVEAWNRAKKSGNDVAAADAWQRVVYAAADLMTYPKEAKPGLPSPSSVALGLDDPKPEGAPHRARREGLAKTVSHSTAKLRTANSIARKYPQWRTLIWDSLVERKSPWLDHTAVAALTGARPVELSTAQIQRVGDELRIGITGAKVSDTKGQEWRMFTLKNDGTPEFAHLMAKAHRTWGVVGLPEGVIDYPDAFSAALARAGQKVLPKAGRMSGYVYRHIFASDIKADNGSKYEIAAALGHAVTKTQNAYGRAAGGTAGKRSMSVQCARPIKATHGTGYASTPSMSPPSVAQVQAVFTTPSFSPTP